MDLQKGREKKEKMFFKSHGKQHGTIYQPLRSGRIWHKVNF